MLIQLDIRQVRPDELADVCEALGEATVATIGAGSGAFNVQSRWSDDHGNVGEAARWTGVQLDAMERFLQRSAAERVSPPCAEFTAAAPRP